MNEKHTVIHVATVEEIGIQRLDELPAYKLGEMAGSDGLGPESNPYAPDTMSRSHRHFEAGRKSASK